MNKIKVFGLAMLIVLGFIAAPLFSAVDAGLEMDAAQTVDKALVAHGDIVTYTIRVENIGDETVDPIFIAETLSPYVDYVPGSTWAYKGSASLNVTNAWLSDGLNLGKLIPGQTVTVEFKAKVKDSTPDGALIESVVQIKKTWLGEGTNEWIQCAARSVLGESIDQPHYSPKKSVDKAIAVPGEILTYTIDIKNTGDTTLHSVFLADTLPGLVKYVSGSTKATKGDQTVSVTDNWFKDGLNLGKLEVGQEVTVVFKVKVKDNAPNGQLIENVAQFKTNELPNWIQCAARTVVDAGEILAAVDVLPSTGPKEVLATSLFLGYLGVLLRKLKLTKYF